MESNESFWDFVLFLRTPLLAIAGAVVIIAILSVAAWWLSPLIN